MSHVTALTLCIDYSGDKGLEPFLEKIAGIERFHDTLQKIDTSEAGGTRNYTGAIYANCKR
ncbi:hypothetical protein [Nocardia vulneris]|uniref:Uncharacterized protein n=1 Tax=Nocardia vulneris TaxID=1141657 RepID=A0ABR4ZD46_9NOCA|nr:hypothetical protein [Nocardia vulneris]KIA63017.1 hypothetical protein FG87_21885 [Nocardia vulneris]